MSALGRAPARRATALLALCAGAAVGAIGVTLAHPAAGPTASAAAPTSEEHEARPQSGYERELARIDRELDIARRFADAEPRSSRRRSQAAALALARARLTGDPSDHAACEREIALAFDAAMEGAGPLLLRASFEASVHRFDRAEADLAVLRTRRRPAAERAEALALEGDIAAARGLADEALVRYDEALALRRDPWTLSRLAHARLHAGDVDGAETAYAEAERLSHPGDPVLLATLALGTGKVHLAAGRLGAARARLEDAERILSGWWRADEALAELALAEGRAEDAIARLEVAVERTGSPALMDRLAEVLDREGRPDEAAPWRARARTVRDERGYSTRGDSR